MTHQISIEELKDFKIEHVLASIRGTTENKDLIMSVNPIIKSMLFNVCRAGSVIYSGNDLAKAVHEYNSI
jgi:hypothetical protein